MSAPAMKAKVRAVDDPLEREFIAILNRHAIRFERPERQAGPSNLDFYLPDLKLSVEVKAWSCERLHGQLRNSGKEQEGILVIVGIEGVRKFGKLLEGRCSELRRKA